jgi:hypothetical protein
MAGSNRSRCYDRRGASESRLPRRLLSLSHDRILAPGRHQFRCPRQSHGQHRLTGIPRLSADDEFGILAVMSSKQGRDAPWQYRRKGNTR